jgi:hypothetical protein
LHCNKRPPAKRTDIVISYKRFLEAFSMENMSTGGSGGSARFDGFQAD